MFLNVLSMFTLFFEAMEPTQRLESSENSEELKPKKLFIDLVSDEELDTPLGSEDSPRPVKLKRNRAFMGITLPEEYDDDYDKHRKTLKYNNQDRPLVIPKENEDLDSGEKLREVMNDVMVFDRSAPPDVLWYLNQFFLPPTAAIKHLRSAASYISRQHGINNGRGSYKPPRRDNKKKD